MDQQTLKKIIGNEQGSTLVLALLVMVILSLLGITAMTTTNSDMRISRSQRIYNTNFALAEAAVRIGTLAVRQAEYIPVQDLDKADQSYFEDAECPFWLHAKLPNPFNIKDSQNWNTLKANTIIVSGEQVQFIVRYDGPDGNFDASGKEKTSSFRYTIFGRSASSGGEVIVQMGYKIKLSREKVDSNSN
ncbi:MAG: hypothetical protein JEZ02_16000 [Desulfatibacillum sp.]|nr:hypothetical protein [Desulfatibacillum sp.]